MINSPNDAPPGSPTAISLANVDNTALQHVYSAGRGQTYQASCWLLGGNGALALGVVALDALLDNRRRALLAFGLAAARLLPDAPTSGGWPTSLGSRPRSTLQQFRLGKDDGAPGHRAEA